jgi:hypothetical protein
MLIGIILGLILVNYIATALVALAIIKNSIDTKALANSTHQIVMPNSVFQTLDEDTKAKMVKQPEEYDTIQ